MNNLPTPVNEKVMALPNGLKKRLISNLVLEAVLDRAMEDFQERREEETADSPDLKETSGKEEEEGTGDGATPDSQAGEDNKEGNKHNSEASSTPNDTKSGVKVDAKNEHSITEVPSSIGEDANRDDFKTDHAPTAKPEEASLAESRKGDKIERGKYERNDLKESSTVSGDCQKEEVKEPKENSISIGEKQTDALPARLSSVEEKEEPELRSAEPEGSSPSPSPPPSSVASTTPSVPAQHSVFKVRN